VAVVEDDGRKVLDLEPPDRLGPQVLVGDDLERLDVTREHGPGAADGAEVHPPELPQRLLHGLPPVSLAHRALQPQLQQGGGELVHAAGRRGADGPDDVAGLGRRGPGVVDDGALDVDREPLAFLDEWQQAPMGRIAGRVHHAPDPHAIAGLERGDVGVAERCRDVLDAVGPDRDAHQVMASTMALKVGLGRIALEASPGSGR
jgi:hypothetical protein